MKNSITLIFVLSLGVLFAQCPPPEKMVSLANKVKSEYGISTQSRSGALISGQNYEMAFIGQNGYDYRISAGTMESDKGNVSFDIYEMVTEKDASGKYQKVKKVIVSSKDTEDGVVEIQTDKARKLTIQVFFTDGDTKKPTCICVLIEDKKSTKLGF